MRRLIAFVSVIALLSTVFHAGPQQAWACSCESGPHADDAYIDHYLGYSDAVVIGEIESWDPMPPETRVTTRANVRVSKVYSGDAPRRIEVFAVDDDVACGYEEGLRSGGEHVLSLELDGLDRYQASYCSSWPMPVENPVSPEDKAVQALLAGLERETSGPPPWVVPAVVAAGTLALAGIVALSRRISR